MDTISASVLRWGHTGRIEIGITNHRDWKKSKPPALTFEIAKLVSGLSSIPVSIYDDVNETQQVKLLDASEALTIALLSATTKHSRRNHAIPEIINKGFWVGRPTLYIRCASNEKLVVPSGQKPMLLRATDKHAIKALRVSDADLSVWIHEYDLEEWLDELPIERDTRVLLSRFLAEQHTIARFEEYVSSGLIDLKGQSLKQRSSINFFRDP